MPSLATATRETLATTLGAECNSGFCRIYSGTRPTDANTALSGNTLLAELPFAATAFPGGTSDGVAAISANIADASADATGTASFARLFKSNGTTVVMDCSVTATGGGGEIQLSSVSVVTGATVTITAFSITQPAGS